MDKGAINLLEVIQGKIKKLTEELETIKKENFQLKELLEGKERELKTIKEERDRLNEQIKKMESEQVEIKERLSKLLDELEKIEEITGE